MQWYSILILSGKAHKFQCEESNMWYLLLTTLARISFVSEAEDDIFCLKLYIQKAFLRKDSKE